MKMLAGLCLAACAAAAAELPLGTDQAGRTTFGDARMRVAFNPATSLPATIAVDGEELFVPNGSHGVDIALPNPVAGLPRDLPVKGLGVSRVGDDVVRGSMTAGPWRIDGYVQLVPERRAIRRWFSFEWTGTNAVKFSTLGVRMGTFRCAEGKGFYILPWRWRDRRETRRSRPPRRA